MKRIHSYGDETIGKREQVYPDQQHKTQFGDSLLNVIPDWGCSAESGRQESV
jgi:hypothetical protein